MIIHQFGEIIDLMEVKKTEEIWKDRKEYKSCKTLKEAIKRRNEILNEKI